MTAPDDLDGVAVVAAIAPACVTLALGAPWWAGLALLAGAGWGVAVAVVYLRIADTRGPSGS